ncbi:MAG: hypothetical protein FJZ38_25915 [Candidatus Rokubacteria bacterium]|nr:hypothetical protein [Candidatus Rokubacteria bacterium]
MLIIACVLAGAVAAACSRFSPPDPAWLAARDALEPAPVIAVLNGETCARAERRPRSTRQATAARSGSPTIPRAAPLWIPWILTRSPLDYFGRARSGAVGPREQQLCRC